MGFAAAILMISGHTYLRLVKYPNIDNTIRKTTKPNCI